MGARAVWLLAALAAAVAVTAAASAGGTGARAPHPAARGASRGTVSVLYAGSLVKYMEGTFGPAFERSSGYAMRGYGGGSSELASEIRGGVRRGDVFISAAAAADRSLEGAAGGGWVSWYSTFMATPLELAYNPASALGKELRRGVPWWKALTQGGVRVGRTDPKLDPKGVLTVEAVRAAARKLRDAALARALGSLQVFPETSLVGRLQSGQLDAGFFYAVEAKNAKLATVPLTPAYKYAEYTLTILNGAADAAGAAALVRLLLSSARSLSLRANGLNPMTPQFAGRAAAVPAPLRGLVGAH